MNNFTKLIGTAALVASGAAASAQTLYDNFENTRLVSYPVVEGTLTQNTANPGSNPVNSSPTCATYVRAGGAQYAVLVVKPNNARMADVAAYTTGGAKRISVKFRSPAVGVTVGVVLQNSRLNTSNYPTGKFGTEFTAVTTKTNEWETLTFVPSVASANNFDATVTSADIDQMLFQVAPGTNNAATYYLDDIMGPELVTVTPPSTATPILLDNFETTRLLDYPSADGTLTQTAANPGSTSANTSATCASFVRAATDYATINITPKTGRFVDVSPYVANTQAITMKFRSPAIGTKVQLVLQNRAKAIAAPYTYPQGNFAGTLDATTTVANAWETLTFRFTPGAADATVTASMVDQIAMLIAPGTQSTSTYYFDDVTGPAQTTAAGTRAVRNDVAAFEPAYPNPTSGRTQLPFSLTKAATVSLAVYDHLGRRVADVLRNEFRPAGAHTAELNAARLAPGIYTCHLTVNGVALSRSLSVE